MQKLAFFLVFIINFIQVNSWAMQSGPQFQLTSNAKKLFDNFDAFRKGADEGNLDFQYQLEQIRLYLFERNGERNLQAEIFNKFVSIEGEGGAGFSLRLVQYFFFTAHKYGFCNMKPDLAKSLRLLRRAATENIGSMVELGRYGLESKDNDLAKEFFALAKKRHAALPNSKLYEFYKPDLSIAIIELAKLKIKEVEDLQKQITASPCETATNAFEIAKRDAVRELKDAIKIGNVDAKRLLANFLIEWGTTAIFKDVNKFLPELRTEKDPAPKNSAVDNAPNLISGVLKKAIDQILEEITTIDQHLDKKILKQLQVRYKNLYATLEEAQGLPYIYDALNDDGVDVYSAAKALFTAKRKDLILPDSLWMTLLLHSNNFITQKEANANFDESNRQHLIEFVRILDIVKKHIPTVLYIKTVCTEKRLIKLAEIALNKAAKKKAKLEKKAKKKETEQQPQKEQELEDLLNEVIIPSESRLIEVGSNGKLLNVAPDALFSNIAPPAIKSKRENDFGRTVPIKEKLEKKVKEIHKPDPNQFQKRETPERIDRLVKQCNRTHTTKEKKPVNEVRNVPKRLLKKQTFYDYLKKETIKHYGRQETPMNSEVHGKTIRNENQRILANYKRIPEDQRFFIILNPLEGYNEWQQAIYLPVQDKPHCSYYVDPDLLAPEQYSKDAQIILFDPSIEKISLKFLNGRIAARVIYKENQLPKFYSLWKINNYSWNTIVNLRAKLGESEPNEEEMFSSISRPSSPHPNTDKIAILKKKHWLIRPDLKYLPNYTPGEEIYTEEYLPPNESIEAIILERTPGMMPIVISHEGGKILAEKISEMEQQNKIMDQEIKQLLVKNEQRFLDKLKTQKNRANRPRARSMKEESSFDLEAFERSQEKKVRRNRAFSAS